MIFNRLLGDSFQGQCNLRAGSLYLNLNKDLLAAAELRSLRYADRPY